MNINLDDLEKIIADLEEIHRNSMLEDYIQNPNSIARCFVNGSYKYFKHVKFPIYELKDFIKLIKSVSVDKKKIILNNLIQEDLIEILDKKILVKFNINK